MTLKQIYRDVQRERSRTRKQRDREGRWTIEWWRLRGMDLAYTDVITRLSSIIREEEIKDWWQL